MILCLSERVLKRMQLLVKNTQTIASTCGVSGEDKKTTCFSVIFDADFVCETSLLLRFNLWLNVESSCLPFDTLMNYCISLLFLLPSNLLLIRLFGAFASGWWT